MGNLAAGLIIAQKYKLDRVLAKGGMGSVWSAWNSQLKVPVAVKFMAPALVGSAELCHRFEREATHAAQLRCPQVVQIFEHGVDRGIPFIVMELLEGEDLGARLKRERRLPIPTAARIVSEICKALRRAHDMGIIHRDLKPANIFLARSGDDEMVKVLDFGIAKSLVEAASGWLTKTGQLVGTPQYMSPEQVQCSRTIDHRSDLWSLGLIAFRALTGSPPFGNEPLASRAVRLLTERAPPASSFAPDLGPEVDRFFERALAILPEGRFQSAREMADAMNALAGRASLSEAAPPPAAKNPETREREPPAARPGEAYTMAETVYTSLTVAEDPFDVATTLPKPAPPARAAWRTSLPPASGKPAPRMAGASLPIPNVPSSLAGATLPALENRSSWIVWLAVLAGLLVVVVILVAALTST